MKINDKENVKVFKALSDEHRLKIIEVLKRGEKCACVLLEELELSQSGLSYHMKVLCESGIVESRQEGKWIYYRISEIGRQNAAKLLLDITALI